MAAPEDREPGAAGSRDSAALVWSVAALDCILGFLMAMFGPRWFGVSEGLALGLGLAIVASSIGVALWMTRKRPDRRGEAD